MLYINILKKTTPTVPMKKNISGYDLAYIEYPDVSKIVDTNYVDYLNYNDLAFNMKSPQRGYLFTIYVVDEKINSSSDGFHERNIGTLYKNGVPRTVLMSIGLQPNYNNERRLIIVLESI